MDRQVHVVASERKLRLCRDCVVAKRTRKSPRKYMQVTETKPFKADYPISSANKSGAPEAKGRRAEPHTHRK